MINSVPWLVVFSLLLSFPSSALNKVTVDPSLGDLLRKSDDLPTPHPQLSVGMTRELTGAGFHRTLLTRVGQIYSTSSHVTPDTVESVVLVENVTCDMYVDVDMQISDVGDYAVQELISSSHMDTEKPASLSSHHVVMAFTRLGGKVEFPLHFRYQPPSSSDSPYKTVTVPPPSAFIRTDQLPHPLQQHDHAIKLPCNASYTPNKDHTHCSWTRVKLRGTDDNLELSIEIPRGLEEHRTVVVGVTVFCTLVAAGYIAWNFWKVKDRTKSSRKKQ